MLYLWIALFALSLILEIATRKKIVVWGLPSALVATIFALCRMPALAQIACFLVIFGLGLLLCFCFLRTPQGLAIEQTVGKGGIVFEEVDNGCGRGSVKVNGQLYAARSMVDGEVLQKNDRVSVIAIEGARLICRPISR